MHHFVIEHPTLFTAERFPAPGRLKNFSFKIQHWAVKRTEADSFEELRTLQFRRLKRLLNYAYDTVPFWRDWFSAAGIKPDDIQTLEDMSKIPIVAKAILKAAPLEKFCSQKISPKSRFCQVASFGTTGTPLRIFVDSWLSERRDVLRHRAHRWQGARESDIYIKITRSPLLERGIVLSAAGFQQLPGIKEELYDIYNRNPNIILSSYPSFLYFLAGLIKKERGAMPLRCVIANAETLDSREAEFIREVFQCPIGKRYTSREGGGTIAQTCRLDAYHINIDQCYIEVVDEQGKLLPAGETGRIIISELNNFVMPFIRYEIGDLGKFIKTFCRCGSPLPAISFEGRNAAVFRLSDGRLLHVFQLVSLLHRRRSWIKQFQIVRKQSDTFEIRILPEYHPLASDLEILEDQLEDLFGSGIKFEMKIVSGFRVKKGERMRSFLSTVKEDADLLRFDKFK